VDLVADSVSGPGEVRAVRAGRGAEEPVVVGVLEVELVRLVVAVLRGQFRLDLVQIEGLELEPHHRPRGVLCQHLVDLDADLLAGRQLALDEMVTEDFLSNRLSHITQIWLSRGYKTREFLQDRPC